MTQPADMSRNLALMPWFGFLRSLTFWQATWFLYFQAELSAAEAILLYAVYDVSTLIFEVPSGYMSDRLGRRRTLITSAVAGVLGTVLLASGLGSFGVFALGMGLLGAQSAFLSGTDSALVFESLAAQGRANRIESLQVRLWRFSFTGLALSAVTGGAMALLDPVLPFVASCVSAIVLLLLSLRLCEPPHQDNGQGEWQRIRQMITNLRQPLLGWLFLLGVLMYGYSHIPFVFGQPFILDALARLDLSGEAPLVSGTVTTLMMLTSLLTSAFAPGLRQRIGLGPLLMLAFGLQIALAGVLALGNAPWMILFLFLRMVPDAMSTPFIIARVQPLLQDDSRATFLSLKSFLGRLFFAGSLTIAAAATSAVDQMTYPEMQSILATYAGVGLLCLICFVFFMRKAKP